MSPLNTRLTDLLGIRYPVIQEGLGPYKTVKLAAAVSNAGGLGTVSMPGMTEGEVEGAKHLRDFIDEACSLTDKPFTVNIPVGTTSDGEVLPFSAAYVRAVVESISDPEVAKRLKAITTSAGAPGVVRGIIRDSGLIHLHKVGGTRQAIRAEKDGVDGLIVSGYEAGGHTHSRPVSTIILGPSVADHVSIPTILTGGFRDGRGLAAALCLGADGIAMGTRFVASRDNTDWNPAYAQRINDAKEGDDIIFDAIYGPSRALPSRGIAELAELVAAGTMDTMQLTAWKDGRLIGAQRDGDLEPGLLPAGQVSGAINDLIDVDPFVRKITEEAAAILGRLSSVRIGGEVR
ncbi:nitronate monooxygenase [Cryobacterium sp. TMS1-20-1]|nr:nitronate monooxygenase [Cryobacterium sp. TMS1-20-1]